MKKLKKLTIKKDSLRTLANPQNVNGGYYPPTANPHGGCDTVVCGDTLVCETVNCDYTRLCTL